MAFLSTCEDPYIVQTPAELGGGWKRRPLQPRARLCGTRHPLQAHTRTCTRAHRCRYRTEDITSLAAGDVSETTQCLDPRQRAGPGEQDAVCNGKGILFCKTVFMIIK